jgi:hypothetical protein
MGKPGWTPSIVPNDYDQTTYLVMDNYKSGPVWHQTDVERTDLEAVIMGMLEGQYQNPVRVVGFNTAANWSEDVSADVARELRRRCDSSFVTCRFILKNSWSGTKVATTIFSCRSDPSVMSDGVGCSR